MNLCKGLPDLWFSEDETDQKTAKAICMRCPEQETCFNTALKNKEEYGIWGGATRIDFKRFVTWKRRYGHDKAWQMFRAETNRDCKKVRKELWGEED